MNRRKFLKFLMGAVACMSLSPKKFITLDGDYTEFREWLTLEMSKNWFKVGPQGLIG